MTRYRALDRSQLLPGERRVLRLGGREVALFNIDGTLHAIDNTCPHRWGPLGEGMLEGAVISCPWHGWRFDVRTGEGVSHRGLCVARYVVEVSGDDVLVEVPDSDAVPLLVAGSMEMDDSFEDMDALDEDDEDDDDEDDDEGAAADGSDDGGAAGGDATGGAATGGSPAR
jgi:nitrite reductase (NADH) small subunit/3-phenylpropionate/trans-cinnamate dioxygenase ferredoxin subunit